MSGKSAIQWTDRTWNPTTGCTRVSPGCDHCYAFQLHDQRYIAKRAGKAVSGAQYDVPFSTVQLLPDRLDEPLHWRQPSRIFVDSMSDLFHEDVPDGYLWAVFDVIRRSPQHTFQILTKRPARMRDFVSKYYDLAGEDFAEFKGARGPEAVRATHPSGRAQLFASWLEWLARDTDGAPPPGAAWPTFDWMEGPLRWGQRPLWNVWLGVSVEDQVRADERIPLLLDTPAAVRFISAEPLLGMVDLDAPWSGTVHARDFAAQLDWVIVGGESGPHSRSFDVSWARALRDQCAAAGTAFFMKQLGKRPTEEQFNREGRSLGRRPLPRFGHYAKGNSHNGIIEEWPEDLRIREFPRAAVAA